MPTMPYKSHVTVHLNNKQCTVEEIRLKYCKRVDDEGVFVKQYKIDHKSELLLKSFESNIMKRRTNPERACKTRTINELYARQLHEIDVDTIIQNIPPITLKPNRINDNNDNAVISYPACTSKKQKQEITNKSASTSTAKSKTNNKKLKNKVDIKPVDEFCREMLHHVFAFVVLAQDEIRNNNNNNLEDNKSKQLLNLLEDSLTLSCLTNGGDESYAIQCMENTNADVIIQWSHEILQISK